MKTKDIKEFLAWFKSREQANRFLVERIPFRAMKGWRFEKGTGNIGHESGRFFKIEGVRVKTNFGGGRVWEQPIINQPEVGILGIITRKIGGVRHFLMQAKMEPGNVNINQLSPTVQATKSNYTQVHNGSQPLFLDYFLDRSRSKVLVDQLQSEQGARFLRKRNRNMIIEVEHELETPGDFCWLTLEQIKQLYRIDNFMNMDARSVLSCACFVDGWQAAGRDSGLPDQTGIISWLTDLKTKYECVTQPIPLDGLKDWLLTDDEISHRTKNYFSVVAVSVQAGNREVRSWDQPLVKQASTGIIGFLIKKINSLTHVLIQAKVEPGFIDTVEMMPTVCFSDVEFLRKAGRLPPFAGEFIDCPAGRVKYSALLSEEGGRFYHSQNRYLVVEAAGDAGEPLPENYIWMGLPQLMEFARYNNYLSVETRSLLSCLYFGGSI
jgi:oxidase EvaA